MENHVAKMWPQSDLNSQILDELCLKCRIEFFATARVSRLFCFVEIPSRNSSNRCFEASDNFWSPNNPLIPI